MNSLLILIPMFGVGIGLAAAYGVSRKHRRIHFVPRADLQSELEKFDVEVGETERCVECGEEIVPENVGAVVRMDDGYKFIDDKPTCLDTYDVKTV